MSTADTSGFHPTGSPEVVAENPWFKTVRQPMDFIDLSTGVVKKSAADGGVMNYVEINEPGVLIIADIDGHSTLLVPQERYTTDLIEGKPSWHYELPGGAINEGREEIKILAAAKREFAEELGMGATEFVIIGNKMRGLYPHPFITDRNLTVIARNVYQLDQGAMHDVVELLGKPEQFTWEEIEDMCLKPEGLNSPTDQKIISSAPTVAALWLARMWLQRRSESR